MCTTVTKYLWIRGKRQNANTAGSLKKIGVLAAKSDALERSISKRGTLEKVKEKEKEKTF